MRDHGFLIVEKYERLYQKYKARYNLTSDLYAIPRIDSSPQASRIKYRGIDRDCLTPNDVNPRNLAEIRLAEIGSEMKSKYKGEYYLEILPDEDFIPVEQLTEMYDLLESDRINFETIFVKIAGTECDIPDNFMSIGFEPSYFHSDHFSASCDCMLFPRWHGPDDEGILFLDYLKLLNLDGMFDSAEIARAFLTYYLTFDWTEREGDYFIVEVFLEKVAIK